MLTKHDYLGQRDKPFAGCLPGAHFSLERLGVGDAPVEALAGQHGEFRFGHVKPTAVLGRVVPLEAFD